MNKASPPATVGVIGPGAMGLGIVASLVRNGFRVVARDVKPEANARAAAAGAVVLGSPAEVARVAPIVIVVVVDAGQIDDVLFGRDGLAASGMRDRVVMVASTVDERPRTAARAAPLGPGDPRHADLRRPGESARRHHDDHGRRAARRARAALTCSRRSPGARSIRRAGDAAATKIVNNLLAGANLAAVSVAPRSRRRSASTSARRRT